jgi:hypothetical protein
VHRYSVDLLISGDELDEAEVSRMLGLKTSVFHKKGEPLSPKSKKVRHTSAWLYSVCRPNNEPEWQSLEEGLKCLVEKLQCLEHPLKRLCERFSLDAYCGHFGSGFGGGPTISAQTLGELSDLGLSLTIKTYWGSTEPDE